MPAVTELKSIEELNSLRHTWRELWNQSPDASFFRSWDWLRCYWRAFGRDQKLRTLVVTDESRPLGIVPFVVRSVRTRFGEASVLTYPSGARGPASGPVGPEPERTLSESFRYLSKSREWNAVEFPVVEESGSGSTVTRNSMQAAGFKVIEQSALPCPVVAMTDCWDGYMDERSFNCREQYLQSERHLERFGTLSFYRWRPGGIALGDTDRRWDLFSIFDQLTVNGDDLVEPSIAELALIRELHPAAVDAGAIDMGLLSIAGRTVACSYGYSRNGHTDVLFIAAARESGEDALTVLLGQLIRDGFLRRDQRLVFRPEHSPAVGVWQNQSLPSVSLGHYAWNSPTAQSLKRSRRTAG